MNNDNLKPFTSLSAQAMGSIGGKNSVIARRKKKALKEELLTLLDVKIPDDNGKKETIRKKIAFALISKAINGDVRAFEIIRDTIGEKPTDKQEIINDTPQIVVATQAEADLIKQIQNVKVN